MAGLLGVTFCVGLEDAGFTEQLQQCFRWTGKEGRGRESGNEVTSGIKPRKISPPGASSENFINSVHMCLKNDGVWLSLWNVHLWIKSKLVIRQWTFPWSSGTMKKGREAQSNSCTSLEESLGQRSSQSEVYLLFHQQTPDTTWLLDCLRIFLVSSFLERWSLISLFPYPQRFFSH